MRARLSNYFFKPELNSEPEYSLLYDINVPKNMLWSRIDGRSPEKFNGFIGRSELPTNDVRSYVSFNTKIGGWGGVIDPLAGIEFTRTGSVNKEDFLYTTVAPNPKISIPAFIRNSGFDPMMDTQVFSKMSEREVLLLGDVQPEYVLLATKELDRLEQGLEVENLLWKNNKDLPASYRLNDIMNSSALLKLLILNGSEEVIVKGIENGVFTISNELLKIAEERSLLQLAALLRSNELPKLA